MKTEIQVLEKLKAIIITNLGTYFDEEIPLSEISDLNIKIDFPDIDNMRKNNMFYIQPDYETLEELSINSDIANMNIKLFFLCKGAKSEELIKRAFAYYSAFYMMLKNNQTLDGFIDFAKITDMDYYPAVSEIANITAIEVKLELMWSKEF